MRRSAHNSRSLPVPSFCVAGAMALAMLVAPRTSVAQPLPIPTTINDFFQPGTQPFGLNFPIIAGNACTTCHASFDPVTAPYDRWSVSIMAQASRDPLFHACLAIAEQDAQFVGDLCLRCHTPGAWLDGRSNPTSGAALTGLNDYDGVTCMMCHRMVDPVYTVGESPIDDAAILAALSALPVDAHTGQFVVDPEDRRRGPFDLAPGFGFHEWRRSPYHQKSYFCGTCHDVSNPAYTRVGAAYVFNDLDAPHPTHDKYEQFPIERTFSEWMMSDFAIAPIEMGGRFGGNKTAVSTCQDCHMPDVSGEACIFSISIYRTDLPAHDLNGAQTWILDAILNLDTTLELYDSPSYMAPWLVDEAQARNVDMLEKASDLELSKIGSNLMVRIINQTAHKLPSGYPEGRRMWVNVKFLDATGGLVAERGAYDFSTAELTTTDTKVYEAKLGLDATAAALTGLPEDVSFHFALNNKYYKDNRIPPRGFTNANFASVQAAPVAYSYPDLQFWDDTLYDIPVGARSAEVRVYYQTASKEYIEFLQDANVTNNAGDVLYTQWLLSGMGPPVEMDLATLVFPDRNFLRSDCNQDAGTDIADPVFLLAVLFTGASQPNCVDACDVNDDGVINIADPIYQLANLFAAGAAPPAPYPTCGSDASMDALGCLGSVCP
ncbi:MAG: hypothetical protein ACKVX7_11220 [Planctomycetota bacterium]